MARGPLTSTKKNVVGALTKFVTDASNKYEEDENIQIQYKLKESIKELNNSKNCNSFTV
jgi:hypothetical protein